LNYLIARKGAVQNEQIKRTGVINDIILFTL